jgi:hypothetical protein
MSETWVDAEDYEDIGEGAYDNEDIGEGAYDSEDIGEDFGEESRSARRQRERQRRARLARQRQIVLARRRQAQMRRSRRPPSPARRQVGAPGPSQPAIRAVRSLDLETKVGLDSLRRAVEESDRRANRATLAAVAGTAVNQGLDSFSANLANTGQAEQYLTAGARYAPLLLLSPKKKKGGVEGFVTDPRFIGGVSILGIALLHHFTSRVHSVALSLAAPVNAPAGATPGKNVTVPGQLVATAKDRLGGTVQNVAFTWKSLTPKVLTFPPSSTGDFTAKFKAGTTTTTADVEATAPNGVKGTLTVTVGP